MMVPQIPVTQELSYDQIFEQDFWDSAAAVTEGLGINASAVTRELSNFGVWNYHNHHQNRPSTSGPGAS
ncbi:hypothetical protein R1flu_000055 [Riccia fluitans]|uniref:Uncharacterized protein n=1 Tax=Riccia fluitans TaxID=41844 RepID=A0ABD1XZS0_9MARC